MSNQGDDGSQVEQVEPEEVVALTTVAAQVGSHLHKSSTSTDFFSLGRPYYAGLYTGRAMDPPTIHMEWQTIHTRHRGI